MKHLFVSISLLCMVLLSACGGGEAAPGGQPSPGQSAETAAPSPVTDPMTDPIPDRGEPPAPEAPSTHHAEEPRHEETHHGEEPRPAPSATPAPTPEPTPSVTPSTTPEPSEGPSRTAPTAQSLYETAYAAGGGAATMDLTELLDQFYQLTGEELEDYALYLPEISINIEEYFIAHVKPGQLETVKAACESRLQGLREDAEFYPATGAYVERAQLVTRGDWLFFCVCPDAAGAVSAFQDALK